MNAKILIAAAMLAVALASPALAQDGPQHPRRQHSVNPSYDLYKDARYLGSDPNPTIRALIQGGTGSNGDW